MTAPALLSSIRELHDIRREWPRTNGETEDHYFQRLALELGRREAPAHRGLIRRILRRELHH